MMEVKEKVKLKQSCHVCGVKDHDWHQVYYEESSKLKRAEKSYLTWCEKVKGYVVTHI